MREWNVFGLHIDDGNAIEFIYIRCQAINVNIVYWTLNKLNYLLFYKQKV